MRENSLFFNWIMEMSETQRLKTIDNLKFVSYPYTKYGSMVVSMKTTEGLNYQILELANEYTMGHASYQDYKDILPTLIYFGKRIELALNLLSGKTNDEIEQMIKEKEE